MSEGNFVSAASTLPYRSMGAPLYMLVVKIAKITLASQGEPGIPRCLPHSTAHQETEILIERSLAPRGRAVAKDHDRQDPVTEFLVYPREADKHPLGEVFLHVSLILHVDNL